MRLLLASVFFFTACDEPEVEPTPSAVEAVETPDPSPESPAEAVPATPPPAPPPAPSPPPPPLDPPSYVERNLDLPAVLECPGREVCVTEYDFVVWVLKDGWRHHYRLDYGSPTTPIRAGDAPPELWHARLESGVGHVLGEERARRALGHCSLAGWMPSLYGVSGGIEVTVPPATGTASAPGAVTPATANRHLQDEYGFIDVDRAQRMEWFSDAEAAAMTLDTFDDPQVRLLQAFVSTREVYRELNLAVVFSAESRRVYVLERSYEVPMEERSAGADERQAAHDAAFVDFLQRLEITSVRVDAMAACEIPEALGGRIWMPLQMER